VTVSVAGAEKRIGITRVHMEEDAGKLIHGDDSFQHADASYVDFNRCGVPLIEIGTCPDIKDPEHAKETAEKLGMILRSTGKVKRGIGTIRQDVNVSISNGARVEIKGFQELKGIPKVIENEVKRQLDLVKKGKKVSNEVRKAKPDGSSTFLRPMPSAARMYPETDVKKIIPRMIDAGAVELIDDKVERLVKSHRIGQDLARIIAKKNIRFEEYVKKFMNRNFIFPVIGSGLRGNPTIGVVIIGPLPTQHIGHSSQLIICPGV